MHFAEPRMLWLLIPLCAYFLWTLFFPQRNVLYHSGGEFFKALALRRKPWSVYVPSLLRFLALASGIVALARPQWGKQEVVLEASGIDIMLAIDISGSMRALDFEWKGSRLDRLSVLKNVLKDFISERSSDRIGLVAFGSRAYTVSPLTLDHTALLDYLQQVRIGDVDEETAIGDGLGLALKRLKDVPGKSKIVILLSDGVNNAGVLHPLDAAKIASDLGIKVYTILVGKGGKVPYPVGRGFFGTEIEWVEIPIDAETLQEIALATRGKFYRAEDSLTLANIYKEINKLEKTEAKYKKLTPRNESFAPFVWFAIVCVLAEMLWQTGRRASVSSW